MNMLLNQASATSHNSWLAPLAVNQAFPINWIWWVTMLVSIGILSLASELVNYYLIDLREIKLVRATEIGLVFSDQASCLPF